MVVQAGLHVATEEDLFGERHHQQLGEREAREVVRELQRGPPLRAVVPAEAEEEGREDEEGQPERDSGLLQRRRERASNEPAEVVEPEGPRVGLLVDRRQQPAERDPIAVERGPIATGPPERDEQEERPDPEVHVVLHHRDRAQPGDPVREHGDRGVDHEHLAQSRALLGGRLRHDAPVYHASPIVARSSPLCPCSRTKPPRTQRFTEIGCWVELAPACPESAPHPTRVA